MHHSLRTILLLIFLHFGLSQSLLAQLDSIQSMVDSKDPTIRNMGFIALAEYHFPENDSLSKYILKRADLENAGLVDSVYRNLTLRKSELMKRLYDHGEGLKVINRALAYAAKNKDSLSLAKFFEQRATHNFYLFNYDSCQADLDQGIELLRALKLEEEKGNLILKSASVDYAIGDYERAITRAFESTEIFKKSNLEKQLGVAYLQLGNIYYFLKNYEDALTYYDLAAVHFKKSEDEFGYYNALSNIGLVNIEKGRFTKGIQLQHLSLRHFRKEKRTLEQGNTFYYLGKAFSGLQRMDSSEYYLNLSIKANQESGYNIGVGFAYWVKAKNRLQNSQPDSALHYNQLAMDILDRLSNFELEKLLLEQLSRILAKKGDHKEALEALRQSLRLKDSLDFDYKMLDRLASNQRAKQENTEYELKLAKEKSVLQANENKRQQQLIIAISIIAFLLVIFLIGLIFTNRRNKSLQQQLIENKDTIEHELETKKALLKEIHHRVKNNLQIISSMLSIQAQYLNDPHLDDVIGECRSRILSMSLIHESLYKKEDEEQSLFSNYIKQLIPQLINAYHVDQNSIDLKMNIEDFELSLDDSVPCGLLINEIVSNSLKHAFPKGSNGQIKLKMFKKNQVMILQVSDNGIGLQEEIDPSKQDTFGFLLIYTLANQLEANIIISREDGLAFDIRWETKKDKMLTV